MLLNLLFFACNSGSNIKATNAQPTIEITSHNEGDAVFTGVDIEFRSTASDPDDVSSSLEVAWRAGDRVICPFSIPSINGESTCVIQLQEGEDTVTAEVRDDDNSTDTATLSLMLISSEAPTANIISPRTSGVYYKDILIGFEGEASDAEDGFLDLTVVWTSTIDGVLPMAPSPDSNGYFSDFVNLDVGDHGIELTVTDTSGKTATASTSVVVKESNTEPTCSITVPQMGETGAQGDLIIFQGTVDDIDIPSSSLLVEWSSDKDGMIGTSTPNSSGGVSFPYSELSSNTHVVSMIVTDEVGATCVTDVIYTVGSAPEINVSTPIDGDVYNEGENILFSAEITDNEDNPNELTVEWSSSIDGLFSTTGPSSSDIAQFSIDTLSPGSHTMMVKATDIDGLYSDSIFSISINSAPSMPTVTILPDPAYTGDDLIVSAMGSIDQEGDTITYLYEWFLDGISSGFTSTTLLSTDTSKGETWSVRATPTDGMVEGAYAEVSIEISNTAPEMSSVNITPVAPSTQDTLTCSYLASDTDGDTVSVNYGWYMGNNVLSSITSMLEGPFQQGDILTCRVTPTDGDDIGVYMEASVTVSNAPPSISSVLIQSSSLYTNDVATVAAIATDPDGNTLAYKWDWYVDSGSGGVLVQSNNTSISTDTLDGVFYFDKADSIYVELFVTDGSATTNSTSSSVIILNTPPDVFNELITPATPVAGLDDLVCSGQHSDADGDSVSVSYSWTKDAVATSYTGDTIPTGDIGDGEYWICTMTPNDGTVDGVSVQVSVTVGANGEGAVGSAFCSSAGAGSDGIGNTMTGCFAEVGIAGTVATDTSGYTWQPGSIFVFDPE